jgi:methylisocitrate lyase
MRLNRAAEEGADLGLLFPRNRAEAEQAPKACKLPLVYVMSRGNRDGRPIFSIGELESMGYVACIDAQVMLLAAFEAQRKALDELRATGAFTGLTDTDMLRARKAIEDLVGLEEYYAIEAETVEKG